MKPVRTCVGCRQRADRTDLLRVIAGSEELIFDALANKPGRGAWIHPSSDCLQKASERGAFARALRLKTGLTLTQEQAETMMAKNG
jgi:predicted RNA-binding protein YlxR (DUF448 family)